MKKKIKLLADWGEYKKGTILSVDEATAKELIDSEVAEDMKAAEAKAAEIKTAKEAEAKRLEEIKAAAVAAVQEVVKGMHVEGTPGIQVISSPADRKDGGFRNFSDFAMSAKHGSKPGAAPDDRLVKHQRARSEAVKAVTGMSMQQDSDGGFLVPEEFSNNLMEKASVDNPILESILDIPMSTNSIKVPFINEISRANDSRAGGLKSRPTAEGGQFTNSNPTFGQAQINLNKITGMVPVSDEILKFSPISLEPLLSRLMSDEIRFRLINNVVNGTGSGESLGVKNAPATISVAKVGSQTADTIVSTNVINMWSRLHAGSMLNAKWYVSQDTFPQLVRLNIALTSTDQLIFMPPGGISGKPFSTIFGADVIPIEQAGTLGDKGDIFLADFSQYMLGKDSDGISTATSIHLRFDFGETVFRWNMFADGQPWWSAPLTPFNGGPTQSPFVFLDERA